MSEQRRTALKQLQKLDLRIEAARERVRAFDPKFEEVELPALELESEAEKTRARLQEMKLEERRLTLSVEEKRARQERLDERLGSVRNLREEAAVSAELEMVKRALQADEQELLAIADHIRRAEERLAELTEAAEEARAQVEPALAGLRAEREEARDDLEALQAEREAFVATMDESEIRLYDGIRRGGRTVAVAEMTEDGACGHCFGIIPLQAQNEIRHGTALIRCEACGVILTAPEPEDAAAEPAEGGGQAVGGAGEEPAHAEGGEEPAEEPEADAGGEAEPDAASTG